MKEVSDEAIAKIKEFENEHRSLKEKAQYMIE